MKRSVAFGHSKQLHLERHQNGCPHLLLAFSLANDEFHGLKFMFLLFAVQISNLDSKTNGNSTFAQLLTTYLAGLDGISNEANDTM